MGFAPIIGAVAGAVGTVSQISSQSRQAKIQQQALTEQRESMTKQFELLNKQRQFQRDVATAEQGRLRQEVALAETTKLFNVQLQELGVQRAELMQRFQGEQELFAVQQQRLVEDTAAAQEQEQTAQQLMQASQQQEQQFREQQQEGGVEPTQAARGQIDSQSTAAANEAQALGQGEAMATFQQLFEMNLQTALQNRDAANRLSQLQEQLGVSEVEARQTMAAQEAALASTQLAFARDNTLLESQMNNAALDAEMSARLFQLEAAGSTDQIAHSASMRQNASSSRSVSASAPSLFSALPGLVGAGMSLYNQFSPPTVSPRITNPLAQPVSPIDYSAGVASNQASRQATQSLDYGRGVMTDRTNSLFNIG